ncbi:MAG TPA: shikimate dehydrogenase [Candidatus Thermoplasmatota archaeon]|nr:shikimate dehydrogenase [Candidatus Thermoplasmatota archaeon]
MTLIVASLTAESPEALSELARGVEADLLEVRLDYLPHLTTDLLADLPKRLGKPLIATLRPTWEGGRFTGTEQERERLLVFALANGWFAADVEAKASFADRILESGAYIILSEHHYEATPGADALAKTIEAAAHRGAWVAKVAVRFNRPSDAAALLAAAHEASRAGHRFALMAVNDPVLRLLAPSLGMALAYTAATETPTAAPGQPHWRDAAQAHGRLLPPAPKDARLVFLFGDPVAHSASPAFQNAGFHALGIPARYLAQRVTAAQLPGALQALKGLNALGANVTVPHKEAVIPHLDELTERAARVGAVNTILNEDGRLIGHNTDGAGAIRALEQHQVDPYGYEVLLLGAGGAARGIAASLLDHRVTLRVANRTPERAEALVKHFGKGEVVPWERRHEVRFDLLVNTTTLGMEGHGTPFEAAHLRKEHVVFDAVYARGGTPLARDAEARGCITVPGEEMLLHQGAAAFELWTKRPAPLFQMRRALWNTLGVHQ